MDGGQNKPNAERTAVKIPQGLNASALDKKLGLRKRARDDAAVSYTHLTLPTKRIV